MKLAYADPPYIGQAKKHYSHDSNCAEVDHVELIKQLCEYDGWALSASSPSLHQILPLCPPEIRIAAWVKPFCSFKPNVNPAYAWEPVLFIPARRYSRDKLTTRDWLSASITLKKGLSGVKPEIFCLWIFALMGAERGDTLNDLYPGSGVVTKMWEQELGV